MHSSKLRLARISKHSGTKSKHAKSRNRREKSVWSPKANPAETCRSYADRETANERHLRRGSDVYILCERSPARACTKHRPMYKLQRRFASFMVTGDSLFARRWSVQREEAQSSRMQIEKVHAQREAAGRPRRPSLCSSYAPLTLSGRLGKNTRADNGTRAPLPDTVNRFSRPPKLNGRTFLCAGRPTCADGERSLMYNVLRILRRHLRRHSSHLVMGEKDPEKRHATSPSDRSRSHLLLIIQTCTKRTLYRNDTKTHDTVYIYIYRFRRNKISNHYTLRLSIDRFV